MSKFTKFILAVFGCGILGALIVAIALYGFVEQSLSAITANLSWILGGFAAGAVGGFLIMLMKIADGKQLFKSDKNKNNEKKPTEQFFEGTWLTQKEMDKKYCGCNWNNLHEQKSGIPIRAELTRHGLEINMLQQAWQTLIIGTTGSGKTSAVVIPTIQILSSTKTKPSLVIADPKGELYAKNFNKLTKEGYEIRVFNVRDPFKSTRWNPMESAYNDFQRSLNLRNEVKVHRGDNPADTPGLKIISDTYNNEWFEFDGIAYPTREAIEVELKAKAQQLENAAHETLEDLAMVLCPDAPNANDPQWTRGARDFINGVMLAMLEDSADPRLGMTKEKFNFFNLYTICGIRDSGKKQYQTLQDYFNSRPPLSAALKKASPIINNADVTTSGFMGIVSTSLASFADDGMCYLTSASELVLDNLADKPTALFIKTPDEKENKHFIATMLITQLYKALVAAAYRNDPQEQTLPRPVYMVLDEFGNLPKFPNLNKIITVGRSRKIMMIMVLQDYGQLNQVYGNDVAKIVRGNCNIHIFLGTQDQETKEEFSKRCGQTYVEVENISESKGKDNNNSKTTSKSKVSRPLITTEELGLLKMGEMIVSVYGDRPMRTTFTQYFKAPQYDNSFVEEPYAPSKYFDKEKAYYDIKKVNSMFQEKDFDDSDFDF